MAHLKHNPFSAVIFIVVFCGIVPFAASAVTVAPSVISTNTVWNEAGSPYLVHDDLRVNAGVTLTIEPNTVVKFGQRALLTVVGSLDANGSEGHPVTFTSSKDDSVGGDSNGDGSATAPSDSDYWSIYLQGGTARFTDSVFTFSDDVFWASGGFARFERVLFRDVGDAVGSSETTVEIIDSRIERLFGDGVWASGGRYVVRGLDIDGTDIIWGDAISLYSGAKIDADYLLVENVGFGSALGLYGAHATATNSIFIGGDDAGIELYKDYSTGPATLYLGDSFVADFLGDGIGSYGGIVSMYRNTVMDNTTGVHLYDSWNAPSSFQSASSSFSGNFFGAVINRGILPARARGNWWGDASGPYHPTANPEGLGDDVSNGVEFAPWLTSDPLAPIPQCCSSVAFIPGLEASRLYTEGSFENQLWEPNVNNDVRILYLSPETGESVNAGIHTKDVIDEVYYATINIYKGFLAHMNDLAASGDIKRFETFPYDWRKDVRDVVADDVELATSTYKMVSRIEALASESQTGKVTLITHSNGGLVAKELINALALRGEAHLIDRVIMVAAPQLGTPKAVFEMLHGMDPFFAGFPKREVTRELGENMKSAYALLPSETYFGEAAASLRYLIEFSTTTAVTAEFRSLYGEVISDYGALRRFLLGEYGARPEPEATAVDVPNVLKEFFLAGAEEHHSALDEWVAPDGIEVIQVIGWGLDTPSGVRYESARKRVCTEDLSVCTKTEVIDPRPLETIDGDGTVVSVSAEAMEGEKYYVNIDKYNKTPGVINRDHKNILEINPLQNLITTLVKQESTDTLPAFISTAKPVEPADSARLRVSVHSPVSLHLYDSLGRHTGPIANPDPASDMELAEEEIPNSHYWLLGEGQYSGGDASQTMTIELRGLELGTFTLSVEQLVGGAVAETTLFQDIPTTKNALATTEIVGGVPSALSVDIDGDGVVDAEITPGGLAPEELLGILKGLIKTLHFSEEKTAKLIKEIEKLEGELSLERQNELTQKRKTEHAFDKITELVNRYQAKGILTASEASELISVIGAIRGEVVE